MKKLRELRKKKGVSLITLVITIIVVIILAAIALRGVGNSTEESIYARYVSDVASFEEQIQEMYGSKSTELALAGVQTSKQKVYYMIANGLTAEDMAAEEAEYEETGLVDDLNRELNLKLNGTKYYAIADDTNIT